MLGGGMLNLKAAFALLERGIQVTLVVYSPEVLSQLMEPADALLIREALDQPACRFSPAAAPERILSDDQGVTGVVLDDGRTGLPDGLHRQGRAAQYVTGSMPARSRMDRGVVVDRFTCTSSARCLCRRRCGGHLRSDHRRADGYRLVDQRRGDGPLRRGQYGRVSHAYGGTFGILNATQVARMPFVSMGIVHTTGTDYETHGKGTADAYRKLVFSPEGDRLVGALFVGDIANAGLYRLVIRERTASKRHKETVIDHRLHYGHLLCARDRG